MNYEEINKIYSHILELLEEFLLKNKDLEGDYYINGARNILTNKINVYVDYLNFLEIHKFFEKSLEDKLNILDLGCGLGDKSVFFKNMFANSQIYGVETTTNEDPSQRTNPPYKTFSRFYSVLNKSFNINLGLYDGYNLDFSDSFFNVIILYAVIEHISPDSRKKFIKKISEKVGKNGYIVITRCPRQFSLLEFVSRKFKLGAHEWVLKKNDLLSLFPDDKYSIEVFKKINNVPNNHTVSKYFYPVLRLADRFLSLVRWPFATDYFLVVKKNYE